MSFYQLKSSLSILLELMHIISMCYCYEKYKFEEPINLQNKLQSFGAKSVKECQMNYDALNKEGILSLNAAINKCNSINITCEKFVNNKYRTLDGSCNNLKNPHWGKTEICLKRRLPFDYGDGVSSLRAAMSGNPLPNARVLSNVLSSQTEIVFEGDFNTLFLIWGQVVAHDLAISYTYKDSDLYKFGNGVHSCCDPSPVVNDLCMAINIPPKDLFYSKTGLNCLDNKRSEPCNCKGGKRVHLNKNTAFQDLSLVYGTTEEDSSFLRSFINGRLKVQYTPATGEILPGVERSDDCVAEKGEHTCFKSGDMQANQNTVLLTSHTLLLRNHNYICERLHRVYRDWDDEKLFQEARRIHIAQIQFITFYSYLPFVSGKVIDEYGLRLSLDELYTKYDQDLDPSIADEYTTVGCRYGHTNIPESVSEIDTVNGSRIQSYITSIKPHSAFFFENKYEKMIRGMLQDGMMKADRFLSNSIRNFLFKGVFGVENIGNDLAVMSILRGRDHGIQGYTYYQKLLKGNVISTFDDLKKVMSEEVVELLKTLYECVHDVDFYIGGLVEDLESNGLVGPTIAALIAEQYRKIKFGDRYWFEHKNQAGSFTPEQLREIRRTSLAKILCETSSIKDIQLQPFKVPSLINPVVPCSQIEEIDFSVF